jgi:16S rRNA (guanine966-N2)-methyltransferase
VRVIAGRLGGQLFAPPNGHRTHPMSDKVRGALFNSLGDIGKLHILDAFAGSGALSFEAISRGAESSVAIDNDRNAQAAITANISKLSLYRQVKLIKASASAWLSTTDEFFDIVLCDPPYDALQPELLRELADRVVERGIVVFSLPPDASVLSMEEFKELSHKQYGDAELYFYQRHA